VLASRTDEAIRPSASRQVPAGRPHPWRSRIETGGASSGTQVAAPLHTTCWGLLKQPYNQKWARSKVVIEATLVGACLVLTVDDDGTGLPPDLRTVVLERVVRVD